MSGFDFGGATQKALTTYSAYYMNTSKISKKKESLKLRTFEDFMQGKGDTACLGKYSI